MPLPFDRMKKNGQDQVQGQGRGDSHGHFHLRTMPKIRFSNQVLYCILFEIFVKDLA
jgi:hypothetical protein